MPIQHLTPAGSSRPTPGGSSSRAVDFHIVGDRLDSLRRRVQELGPPPDVGDGLLRGYWVFPGARDDQGRLVGLPLGVGEDAEVFCDNDDLVQNAEAMLSVPLGGALGHLVTYRQDDIPVDAVGVDTAPILPLDLESYQLTILEVRHVLFITRRQYEHFKEDHCWSDIE